MDFFLKIGFEFVYLINDEVDGCWMVVLNIYVYCIIWREFVIIDGKILSGMIFLGLIYIKIKYFLLVVEG